MGGFTAGGSRVNWRTIPNHLSAEDAQVLGAYARHSPGMIVEIGTGYGASACVMAEANSRVPIVTIDHFEHDADTNWPVAGRYEETCRNLSCYPNVEVVRGWSTAIPWEDRPPIQMLFLDGAHDEASVTADLTTWLPRMAAGGILLLHDWDRHYAPGVTAAARAWPLKVRPAGGSIGVAVL